MRAKLIPSLLVLLFLASIFPHTAQAGNHPVDRPLKMTRGDLQLDWAIDRAHELACGGSEIAGGHSSGQGNFTHLGESMIEVSAAWDIGNLLDPDDAQFAPTSPARPAGGPVAPVLGTGAYPYEFHFNPFTGECGPAVTATGDVTIVAANGDKVFGAITGGETFRLDFVEPGDGVETFATVTITGGTGRLDGATGSFVTHTITRFDADAAKFVIDLAEVLPGGTIAY
jgi:hypothetical protein